MDLSDLEYSGMSSGADAANSADAGGGVPRPRALVVDDEALISIEIADLLRDAGFAIAGPAGTLAEALRLLDEQACQLAVVDLQIDGVIAIDLIEKLRQRAIPLLVVTGLDPTLLPPCVEPSMVVGKPFHGNMLIDRCRQLAAPAQSAA